MKILIDTNVLLGFLQQRESFAEAEEIKADFIVTRNTDDFKNSMVPAITPAAFLKTL